MSAQQARRRHPRRFLADRSSPVDHRHLAGSAHRVLGTDRLLPNSLTELITGTVILNLAGQGISVTNQHLIVEIATTARSQLFGGNTAYFAVGPGGGAIAATVVYSTTGRGAVCTLGVECWNW